MVPWQIPWAGWKDILWRVYASVNDNRLLAVAGGVVFFSLLAIFPAIAAFVSLYGLIADASTIDSHLSLAAGVFPAGAVDILHEQITRLTAKSDAKLGLGFITGLAIALWSANAGMKAIIDALNVVYDEKEKRSFVKLNLLTLLFTLIAIFSLMVALAAVVIAPMVLSAIGLSSLLSLSIAVLRWPLLLVLVTVALAAIYRYGPSRTEPRWQWLSVGSAAAAIGWLITSVLFSWYIAHFGAYNATYGSLGAAVGMMMWMWISAIVILLGGELNAEIEHQTAKDSTVGIRKAAGRAGRGDGRHDRGGALADLEHRKERSGGHTRRNRNDSRSFVITAMSTAALFVSTAAPAQPTEGTAGEARAMLDKGGPAVKEGKTNALDMFNKGGGGFRHRDLSVRLLIVRLGASRRGARTGTGTQWKRLRSSENSSPSLPPMSQAIAGSWKSTRKEPWRLLSAFRVVTDRLICAA